MLFNNDLKALMDWLNARKISLNVSKTDMVICKSKKTMDFNFEIKFMEKYYITPIQLEISIDYSAAG